MLLLHVVVVVVAFGKLIDTEQREHQHFVKGVDDRLTKNEKREREKTNLADR